MRNARTLETTSLWTFHITQVYITVAVILTLNIDDPIPIEHLLFQTLFCIFIKSRWHTWWMLFRISRQAIQMCMWQSGKHEPTLDWTTGLRIQIREACLWQAIWVRAFFKAHTNGWHVPLDQEWNVVNRLWIFFSNYSYFIVCFRLFSDSQNGISISRHYRSRLSLLLFWHCVPSKNYFSFVDFRCGKTGKLWLSLY